jgi:peptide/nickel transport system permease protein
MGRYIFRRLFQSVFTIFGVMILTFFLFRYVAGDIAAAHLGEKATEQAKADWRLRHGYNKPLLLNIHNQILVRDCTTGDFALDLEDAGEGTFVDQLALTLTPGEPTIRTGRYIRGLDENTPLRAAARSPRKVETVPTEQDRQDWYCPPGKMEVTLANRETITIDLTGIETVGEFIQRVNTAEQTTDPQTGQPRLRAEIKPWALATIWNSQFFDHLYRSVTFQSRSLQYNQKLTTVITRRAPRSLALTIPALGLGWLIAMIVSCFVAYFRGSLADKVGVFLSVLGMCIPFLAFMIYGQWLMFEINPQFAYGLTPWTNIYVPIGIMVIASLGTSVRFYRTVILDETNRDYVRTARAKGVPLATILFKHVLKNCMLPILTNLILALPFLFLGNLLLEKYFGIPGLGDLLLTSIDQYDEPMISGLVFLISLVYTLALLITDVLYAVFDPRIRLH